MNMNDNYSAGLMSQSFWFIEMKKLIELMTDGKTEQEIKKSCIEGNLFGAPNEYRARRIYGYLYVRTKKLDDCLIGLFGKSDVAAQKLINLIAILKSDRLFFEFLYEVYRGKIILGDLSIEKADVNIFFRNKEIQSKNVASWNDSTKKKLGAVYLNYMCDANLLKTVGKEKKITPPILDIKLQRYLESGNNVSILKAITGAG